jgi:hypothetical protein
LTDRPLDVEFEPGHPREQLDIADSPAPVTDSRGIPRLKRVESLDLPSSNTMEDNEAWHNRNWADVSRCHFAGIRKIAHQRAESVSFRFVSLRQSRQQPQRRQTQSTFSAEV